MNHFLSALDMDFFWVLLAYATIGFIVSSVFFVSIFIFRKQKPWSEAFLIFCLATIGGVSGFIGGASRESAVGDIIPALLALISGLAIYFFEKRSSHRVISATIALCFSISLFLGFSYGSTTRKNYEFNAQFKEACINIYFNPDTYASGNSLQNIISDDQSIISRTCSNYWDK